MKLSRRLEKINEQVDCGWVDTDFKNCELKAIALGDLEDIIAELKEKKL